MKKFGCSLLAVSFLSAFAGIVSAQEKSYPPPKVLLIMREYTKPGKAGAVHDKAESAFVQAFARAKWSTTHYFGMTSLSGKSRALFFTPYESFEAWEKDAQATEKNAALSAALDRATRGLSHRDLRLQPDGWNDVRHVLRLQPAGPARRSPCR